jgi:MOSC domain-containing protein YiiM
MILEPGSKIESTVVETVQVSLAGFEGDRHARLTRMADVRNKDVPRGTEVPNDRQVTIVAQEELARVALALDVPEVRPEWLGANLCLSGWDGLSDTARGTMLRFPSAAVLRIEAQNQPCTLPGRAIEAAYPDRDDLAPLFPKMAMGLRGLTASVTRPGRISIGDRVRVSPPA